MSEETNAGKHGGIGTHNEARERERESCLLLRCYDVFGNKYV